MVHPDAFNSPHKDSLIAKVNKNLESMKVYDVELVLRVSQSPETLRGLVNAVKGILSW